MLYVRWLFHRMGEKTNKEKDAKNILGKVKIGILLGVTPGLWFSPSVFGTPLLMVDACGAALLPFLREVAVMTADASPPGPRRRPPPNPSQTNQIIIPRNSWEKLRG